MKKLIRIAFALAMVSALLTIGASAKDRGEITLVLGKSTSLTAEGSYPWRWSVDDPSMISIGPSGEPADENYGHYCEVMALGVGTTTVRCAGWELVFDPNADPDWFGPPGSGENVSQRRTDTWTITVVEPRDSGAGELYNGNAWELSDGTLTVTGEGRVSSGKGSYPWYTMRDAVERVVIGEGITSLGISSFSYMPNLEWVYIPVSVTEINSSAFKESPLRDVYYGGSEADWNNIEIGLTNWKMTDAERHYNAAVPAHSADGSSTSEPTATPSLPTPSPTPSKTGFSDVEPGSWYADAVAWAVENGITIGTSSTTFSPDQTCTTGEFVTFLWRAEGSPEPLGSENFSDVSADDYYYKAAAWAKQEKVMERTNFYGGSTCYRWEVVKYLWYLNGRPDMSGTSSPFSDVTENSKNADAVKWAARQGITAGKGDGTFGLGDSCTRAQIMTFLYRAYH